MLKIAVIGVCMALLVVGLGGFFLVLKKRAKLSGYEDLLNPKISRIPDTHVLAVSFETEAEGLKTVFGLLFKGYFKMKGVSKIPWRIPPPRARYENTLDFGMEEDQRKETFAHMIWKGAAAIPLSDEIATLPNVEHDTLRLGLEKWHYGEVAEILHIGPYEMEAPTVQILKKYIADQGYEISGLHEEVYLRGPGTPLTKPDKYYTIIRYPVRRK